MRRHTDILKRKGMAPYTWDREPPRAYVNQARWVCDCPNCNNSPSVSLRWGKALCHECGAVFNRIIFPPGEDIARIEKLFIDRDEMNRNWYPWRESVVNIEDENMAQGRMTLEESEDWLADTHHTRVSSSAGKVD